MHAHRLFQTTHRALLPNVLTHVKRNNTREVAAMLKEIPAQQSREAVEFKAANVADQSKANMCGKVAEFARVALKCEGP